MGERHTGVTGVHGRDERRIMRKDVHSDVSLRVSMERVFIFFLFSFFC